MLVVYKYKSKRTKEIEWRRGIILGKIANTSWKSAHYSVESIDFGTVVDVYFKDLKKMFKPFGQMPKQAVEAKLAGISPFLYNKMWDVHATNYFKKKVAENKSMLAMVAHRAEVSYILSRFRGHSKTILKIRGRYRR